MDLNRLPFLPLHFFYFQFSASAKRTFLYGMILLLLTGACFLYLYLDPYSYALETNYLSTYETETVDLPPVTHHYRTFPLEAHVVWQSVGYAAGPLLPKPSPLYAFALFQLLAWTLFLAGSTLIRSRWVYGFYLLFALFIFFSGLSETIVSPDDPAIWGIRLAMIASFLIPAYLWQTNILRWQVGWRALVLTAIAGSWFGVAALDHDWTHVHDGLTQLFYYEILVLIFFLIFVGKDVVNLIVLIATNHPNQRQRWPVWLIYIALGLWMVVELLWLNEFLNWNLLGGVKLGIRPSFVLLLTALFTVFTSQNQYHQVRTVFSSQVAFTLIILALSTVVLSFCMVNISTGDHFFGYALDRLVVITSFAMSIGYGIFVLLNHHKLLQRRLNIYYIMTQSKDLRFFVVWLLGLGMLFVIAGSDGYKSRNLFVHNALVHFGDQAWLNADFNRAKKAYRLATEEVNGSVKAHYNLGALSLSQNPNIEPAVNAYLAATAVVPFPWARINAANLLLLGQQTQAAKTILQAGKDPEAVHPALYNNLGRLYVKEQKPDSAIACFQAALLADLSAGPIYSNLAEVYRRFDRPEAAATYYQGSIEASPAEPMVWANYFAWKALSNDTTFEPLPGELAEDLWAAYHFLLVEPTARQGAARQTIRAMANAGESPDASLLEGYMLLQHGIDSADIAISRLKYLAEAQPSFRPKAYRLLGAFAYQWDMWEMARHYFSAEGSKQGRLYAAKVNIDLGWKNAANDQLSLLRVEDESLWEACSRELSLLLRAYNQPIFAETEWTYGAFDPGEYIRLGVYADSMNQYITALEAFRTAINQDSQNIAPYLEMGKIYNRYADTLAKTNLAFGLEKEPRNPALQIAYALAEAQSGDPSSALDRLEQQVDTASLSVSLLSHWMNAWVRSQLIEGADTLSVADTLSNYVQVHPMDERNTLLLAELFTAQNLAGSAEVWVSDALVHNPYSYSLWLRYAALARLSDRPKDAGFGAQKAIELTPDEPTQRALSTRFAKELRLLSE